MIWDRINVIQRVQGEYDAETLSQEIIRLSTLYANLAVKIAEFERDYQEKLGEIMDSRPEEPFNKIELAAKRFPEYFALKKAMALEKSLIAVIRAGNRFIKIKENEQGLAKYQ